MHRGVAGVVVALLAVTAGCSGLGGVQELGPVGGDEHPLAGETVEVVVDGTPRERALTVQATDYWNANAQQYAGFDVTFEVADGGGSATPDVTVTYMDSVTDCGDDALSAGCAPRPNASTGLERPAEVRIQQGLANDSTLLVAKHEFGHLLGLEHDDDPQSVMRHARELTEVDQPNATERRVPWTDDTVTVAVRNGSMSADQRAAYREEVRYAVAYFQAGADGAMPANLSVELGDDARTADVVVEPVRRADCRSTAGSCSRVRGPDPDDDGAVETYDRVEILLVEVDREAASWHVARQLALAIGIDPGELPESLLDATYDERRGEWHG